VIAVEAGPVIGLDQLQPLREMLAERLPLSSRWSNTPNRIIVLPVSSPSPAPRERRGHAEGVRR